MKKGLIKVAFLLAVFASSAAMADNIFDPAQAIEVFKDQITSGTTVGAPSNAAKYHGSTWNENGPERLYKINVTQPSRLTASLTDVTVTLDVFILTGPDTSLCVAAGDRKAIYPNATPGIYYIIVDGTSAAAGSFNLIVEVETGFPPAPATIIWREGFEGNTDVDWHTDYGVWETGVPTSGPGMAFVGQKVAATILTGDYPDGKDTRLIRHTSFIVPDSLLRPRLGFWVWRNFSSDDWFKVQLKVDGESTWKDLAGGYGGHGSYLWIFMNYDLSAYAGKSVQIAFYLHSQRSGYWQDWTVASGAYIDNVCVYLKNGYTFEATEAWDPEDVYEWTYTGSWQIGVPTAGYGKAYSEPFCLATVLDGNYAEWGGSNFISVPFTIPKSSTTPVLRFRHWYSFNAGDWGGVYVQTASGRSVNLDSYSGGSQNWIYAYLDLSSFQDSTISLNFYFESATTGYWGDYLVDYGWMIDDVSVSGIGQSPVILSFAATPSSGSAPLTVNFVCQASDPDGSISEFRWDFDGNGTVDQTTATGEATYRYSVSGTFNATCTVVDNVGALTTAAAAVTVVSPTEMALTLPDTSFAKGSTFSLPVIVGNAASIAGGELKLTYDSAVLQAVKARTSTLTTGFSIQDSVTSGAIAITFARANAIASGSGDLLYVEFQIKPEAAAGIHTAVGFAKAVLYDESTAVLPVTTKNGNIQITGPSDENLAVLAVLPVSDTLEVTQTLSLSAQGKNQAGAALIINPAWQVESLFGNIGTVNPASGAATTFTASGPGDGVITASQDGKTASCVIVVGKDRGDINLDGAGVINVQDAILGLQIIVNKITPHLYQKWAADFSGDGAILENDILQILNKTLGTMMLKGSLYTGPAWLETGAAERLDNSLIRIPVLLHGRPDIAAGGLEIGYDKEKLTPLAVQACQSQALLMSDWSDGAVIRISTVNTVSILDNRDGWFNLIFRLKGESGQTPPLQFNQVRLFDRAAAPVALEARETASATTGSQPGRYQLYQNHPNPFNPETAIRFDLAEPGHAVLAVFNTNGQLVSTLVDADLPAGVHSATWNGRDMTDRPAPAGIYFYRLIFNHGVWSRINKMSLVK